MLAVSTFKSHVKRYDRSGQFKLLSQIDTRGRKTGHVVTCDPEAWAFFCDYYLDDRKMSVALCYDLTAHECKIRGWAWPSKRTIERRIKTDIPYMTLVLEREGERAFKSKCVPRIRRSYEDVPAGDVWCADECTLDFYCQVPNGKGGIKRGRPILTAWLDVRSRMFIGWHIGHRANSDTIVASFKMGVREHGPPLEVHCDNGEDYKSVAGRSKKWSAIDQQRLADLYSELEIKVHWAIPYEPQAKIIESHFRAVHGRFDKLFDSYCGNNPEARPDLANKIPVHRLPKLDEVREQFSKWLCAHHAKPQSGDSMYNLSPQQAMSQFRGKSVRPPLNDALLEFLCAKIVGPVKVTKDGVRHQGIQYGQGCDALYRLQGERVLLRVQPDRLDFVDVCDLNGRPVAKATNDRLTGATQDDIRTAMSRRKRARKIAREAASESAHATRRSTVSAVIAAQHDRNKSEQIDTPPTDPPISVKAVRPDLREAVERIASGATSSSDQARTNRRSNSANLSDLCGDTGSLKGDKPMRRKHAHADELLTTRSLDGESDEMDVVEGDEGSKPIDAFSLLGGAIHAERRRA
ncbi:MAG: hypothetical protein DHS20C16_14860 [Phycisphaerae bacterium]|nr:MAG: hypothetical protein DHS20C16_14860 [Phycisphaerae bacterium]